MIFVLSLHRVSNTRVLKLMFNLSWSGGSLARLWVATLPTLLSQFNLFMKKNVISFLIASVLAVISMSGVFVGNESSAASSCPFSDVYTDDYYYDAVIWAYKNGITEGKDELHFGPKDLAKRSDVVVMLWKAVGCPVVDYAINLDDVDEDAEYAEAVRWALSEKITFGTSETTFSPDEICNRAQMITLIARFAGVEDTETDSKFEDVKPAAYYAAAVKWAKDNGITDGTSETTFSPDIDCTRAQAVTFLYRLKVK